MKALDLAVKSVENLAPSVFHVVVVPPEGRPSYRKLTTADEAVLLLRSLYGQKDAYCYVFEGGNKWRFATQPNFTATRPSGETLLIKRNTSVDLEDDGALFVEDAEPPVAEAPASQDVSYLGNEDNFEDWSDDTDEED